MEEARLVHLLTINEAADRMRVSRQTIYTWINQGKIKPVSTPGGRLRVPANQLLDTEVPIKEKVSVGLFPTRDISELDPIRIEQMGTKEKYWFPRTEQHWYWDCQGDEFLFKAGREGTGENWAEKTASELCKLLGLPHAEYDLATYRNTKGVISPIFIPARAWLRLGNEILARYVRGYEKLRRYNQSQHTVRIVLAILDKMNVRLPVGWSGSEEIKCAADMFVGYLMLDAWIANQDRHHENWGLVILPSDKTVHLAPTFDHASSLGRNETDGTRKERLTTKDIGRGMDRYIERARSAFYRMPSDAKPLSTVEAFIEAAARRPSAAKFWLGKLSQVSMSDTKAVIARFSNNEMSDTAKEFSQAILELNRRRLLSTRA